MSGLWLRFLDVLRGRSNKPSAPRVATAHDLGFNQDLPPKMLTRARPLPPVRKRPDENFTLRGSRPTLSRERPVILTRPVIHDKEWAAAYDRALGVVRGDAVQEDEDNA